jgi:hypothetical protein
MVIPVHEPSPALLDAGHEMSHLLENHSWQQLLGRQVDETQLRAAAAR